MASSSSCFRPASPSRGSQRPLAIRRSGYFSTSSAFFSSVLKPSVYHSFRYVDWKMPTSTQPSSKTSLTKSSSEYFWNFSIGQCVSSGPRPMYAWKHSIQPFAYCSWPLTQFAGLASQKWR